MEYSLPYIDGSFEEDDSLYTHARTLIDKETTKSSIKVQEYIDEINSRIKIPTFASTKLFQKDLDEQIKQDGKLPQRTNYYLKYTTHPDIPSCNTVEDLEKAIKELKTSLHLEYLRNNDLQLSNTEIVGVWQLTLQRTECIQKNLEKLKQNIENKCENINSIRRNEQINASKQITTLSEEYFNELEEQYSIAIKLQEQEDFLQTLKKFLQQRGIPYDISTYNNIS